MNELDRRACRHDPVASALLGGSREEHQHRTEALAAGGERFHADLGNQTGV